jgi:hypothetical protein
VIVFFGNIFRISEEAKIFDLLISTEKSYLLSLTKNMLGFILCNIFKNSFGHLGWFNQIGIKNGLLENCDFCPTNVYVHRSQSAIK